MPVMPKAVEVRHQKYIIEQLPGSIAGEFFHVLCRAFGLSWINTAKKNISDLAKQIAGLANAEREEVRWMLATIKAYTSVVHVRVKVNPATGGHIKEELPPIKCDDSTWDSHFVGARSLDQFDLLIEHVEHNFGEAFLARVPSLPVSNDGPASPAPTAESSSPQDATG